MFPRDYEKDFEEVGERFIDKDGLTHIHLRAITDPAVCPRCKRSNIHRNGTYTRKGVKDITPSKEIVVLSFQLRRYLCDDCSAEKTVETGKKSSFTFSTALPNCIPEDDKVSAHVIDAVVQKIAEERVSMEAAAEAFHIAQSSASQQIEERRKAAVKSFKTWKPADTVLIYPFQYAATTKDAKGNESHKVGERCAILGVVGNRAMLYAILDNSDEETILEKIKAIPFDEDTIPVLLLTDYPRPKLHKEVPQIYKDIELGIVRTFSFERMEKLRQQSWNAKTAHELEYDLLALKRIFAVHCYDPINDEFMPIDMEDEDIDELLENYSRHTTKEIDQSDVKKTFSQMLELWKDNLSKHTKDALSGLYELMKTNAKGIAIGLLYEREEYDPAGLLKFLEHCRKNRISFKDLPSWLALVAGVHNKENVTALQMLSSSYEPQPIHGFYIDLNELNALLDA